MSLKLAALIAALVGAVGILLGYYLRLIISLGKKGSVELEIKEMMIKAQEDAKKITVEAETRALETMQEMRRDMKEREEKIKQAESRLIKKEDTLDRRQNDLDQEVETVKARIVEIREIRERADDIEKTRVNALRAVSGMSEAEARSALLEHIERQNEEDFLIRWQKLETFSQEKLEKRAKDILAVTIQRLATSVSADLMSTSVAISSDEVKGKIIGKEGRNIKAFERATGVELIIDDTPGSITISSFDPIRRQIAKVALELLIADGRIQPAKIEEMVEKARQDINKAIKEKGEQAVYECGVFNLDPRIVAILGRLHFRTSYGQNVLQHSIEMAHIAGMIAEELGANVAIAKAGALLHDIGKAVDHEVAGSHVEIGRRILQKFGADELVIKAMQAHHGEYPYETIESVIVQTADAISGGRPGARRDTVENYLKRLSDLEAIANSFRGVERSFALQAGREIRVFVLPTEVTDLEAKTIARAIAVRVESELRYPGEIKVSVIRESRIIEYAR